MTKYIVEWADKDDKHSGYHQTFETENRSRAFAKAWELKNNDNVVRANLKEITTYCFKND